MKYNVVPRMELEVDGIIKVLEWAQEDNIEADMRCGAIRTAVERIGLDTVFPIRYFWKKSSVKQEVKNLTRTRSFKIYRST